MNVDNKILSKSVSERCDYVSALLESVVNGGVKKSDYSALRGLCRQLAMDPSADVRHVALETLSSIGTRRDIWLAIVSLNDPEPIVRMSAISLLSDISPNSCERHVMRMLDDDSPGVRRWAYNVIGHLGWRRHRQLLRDRWESASHEEDKLGIAYALSRIGEQNFSGYIHAMTEKGSTARIRSIAKALIASLGQDQSLVL